VSKVYTCIIGKQNRCRFVIYKLR